MSSELGAGNQPRYSQDSIAEFQFIANRFDATVGRSTGVLVNAITKSGTNKFSGLFRTNFQDSSFNAPDPIANKVLPISDQQYSTAVGGPILKDRLHYFVNFEDEQHPMTSAFTTRYTAFNAELPGQGDSQYRRCAARLSVVAEDSSDGQGVGSAHLHAVWRRLLHHRGGVDHRQR